jgi:hypothetical protein
MNQGGYARCGFGGGGFWAVVDGDGFGGEDGLGDGGCGGAEDCGCCDGRDGDHCVGTSEHAGFFIPIDDAGVAMEAGVGIISRAVRVRGGQRGWRTSLRVVLDLRRMRVASEPWPSAGLCNLRRG